MRLWSVVNSHEPDTVVLVQGNFPARRVELLLSLLPYLLHLASCALGSGHRGVILGSVYAGLRHRLDVCDERVQLLFTDASPGTSA